jgi:hypothetical protein
MAHAQKLTEQVKTQIARIQQLESALESNKGQQGSSGSSSSAGAGAYPQDPTFVASFKEDVEDPEAVYNAAVKEVGESIGSIAIDLDGRAKYHGLTTSSEVGKFRVAV